MMFILLMVCFAQEGSLWHELYGDIKNNNPILKASAFNTKAEEEQRETLYRWENVQLGGYYLLSPNNPNQYVELELSQSIPSPFSRSHTKRWLFESRLLAKESQNIQEQDVLQEATHYLLSLVYNHKRKKLFSHRFEQAQKHLEHYDSLHKAGEISISLLQKVQLATLQYQAEVQNLDQERHVYKQKIEHLKSGTLAFDPQEYIRTISDIDEVAIWEQKLRKNPNIRLSEQAIQVSRAQLKMSQSSIFPDISIGLNTQGTSDEMYSGVFFGLSMPLYRAHGIVREAHHRYQHSMLMQEQVLSSLKVELKSQSLEYKTLLEQYTALQKVLAVVDYELQLEQQLESGLLSFVEYHREYELYNQAEDRLLELEYQLQILLSKLERHLLLEEP